MILGSASYLGKAKSTLYVSNQLMQDRVFVSKKIAGLKESIKQKKWELDKAGGEKSSDYKLKKAEIESLKQNLSNVEPRMKSLDWQVRGFKAAHYALGLGILATGTALSIAKLTDSGDASVIKEISQEFAAAEKDIRDLKLKIINRNIEIKYLKL